MIQNVKLIKKTTIADGTMEFRFEKPKDFKFLAGQFADYTLIDPSETDDDGSTRAFSFAQAPSEDDLVVAIRMSDSAFKRALRDLPVGGEVKLDAPYGDITLHEIEDTPTVLVVGGTGVTPVRSMVAQASHDKTAHKLLVLHSSRTPSDLPYQADFERFATENPNLTYVPVASGEAPDDWQGERGRIDNTMIKKYVSDVVSSIYYLSGPEGMVTAMRHLLVELGASEDNIRTEEFSGY